MTLDEVLSTAVRPALALLPPKMTTPAALVALLAIGGQESGFKTRVQIGTRGARGPARGFWQFEQTGAVHGVLWHSATAALAADICKLRNVAPLARDVWEAMEFDDVLAATFARLLLYSDPRALPALGDEAGMWAFYLRTWRPGKPHPDRWGANYRAALAAGSA